MLVDIPKGHGRGHWARVLIDEYGDNPRWKAIVWCPECGRPLAAVNHAISDTGQMSPSLGHPREYPPCVWHVHPRLLDWAPIPPVPPPHPEHECECCHDKSRTLGGWGIGWGFKLICPRCIEQLTSLPGGEK